MKYLSIGLAAVLLAAPLAQAAANPDVLRLSQRLPALDADPGTSHVAAYEQLQATPELPALAQARRSDRPVAVRLAQALGNTAEVPAPPALHAERPPLATRKSVFRSVAHDESRYTD